MVAAIMAPVILRNRPLNAADAAASKARATALAQARATALASGHDAAKSKAKALHTARLEYFLEGVDRWHAEWAKEGPKQSARHRCTTIKQIFVDVGLPKTCAVRIAMFVG